MSGLPPTPLAPPRRQPLSPWRFCLALVVLITSVVLPYTSYHLFSFARSSLHGIKHPHKDSHHPFNATAAAVDELQVVRSYFGDGEGSVDQWDLVASLYFRKERWVTFPGQDRPEETEDEQMDTKWGPWERVFSREVLSGGLGLSERVSRYGNKARAQQQVSIGSIGVRLPGRILRYLSQPTRGFHSAQLVSAFHLIPSRRDPPPYYPLNSTIPTSSSDYLYTPPFYPHLPAPFPVQGAFHAEQQPGRVVTPKYGYHLEDDEEVPEEWKDHGWESLFAKGRAVTSMLMPVPLGDGEGFQNNWTGMNPDVVPGRGKAGAWSGGTQQKAKVVSKTWVAIARDEAVYSLEGFRRKMGEVKDQERTCYQMGLEQAHSDPSCWRRFSDVGHFENLLAVGPTPRNATRAASEIDEDQDEGPGKETENAPATGWRYTPYLTTTLAVQGPDDATALPEAPDPALTGAEEEPDFVYDWEIIFSTVSPIRLAAGTTFDVHAAMADNELGELYGDDWREGTKRILSQPVNGPNTHPLLRVFLTFLEAPIVFAIELLTLYYWYSRSVSTGIAMTSQVMDASADVLWAVFNGFAHGGWEGFGHWIEAGKLGVLWVMQAGLAGRVECTYKGWVPMGVTRRKETRGERRTRRVDWKFGWGMRAGLFLFTFLLTNFLTLPPLISAPSSISTPLFSPSELFTQPFVAAHLINSLSRPLWLSLYTPQILLNHRLGTFAGTYPLTALLYLFQEILRLVPRLGTGLLGWDKWKAMEPVSLYDAIAVVVFGAHAWQAVTLPKVRQDGEDDDEGAGGR